MAIRFFSFFLVFSALFCFFPFVVKAIEIGPLRQTVVLEPGTTQEVTVQVTNTASHLRSIRIGVDTFRVDPGTGSAIFGTEGVAKDWITFSDKYITLDAFETKEVVFTARIPRDAVSKAHYVGLFAQEKPGPGQVGVSARVGSLLFLHVAGQVKESVVVEDFSVSAEPLLDTPLEARVQIRNTGDIHIVPQGEIRIINNRDTVIQTLRVNPEKKVVYPGHSWHTYGDFYTLSLWDVGPLRIQYVIRYGLSNKVITGEMVVWFVPYMYILVLLAVLGVCVVLFLRIRR